MKVSKAVRTLAVRFLVGSSDRVTSWAEMSLSDEAAGPERTEMVRVLGGSMGGRAGRKQMALDWMAGFMRRL
jgi:hypothetical protein